MADQVEIQLPKTIFDERSGFTFTAKFRTRSTAAASTPTTVHYKLYNMSTKEVVKDYTSVSAASSVSVTVAASDLQIKDATHLMERIALFVVADKGLSTQCSKEAYFKIRNTGGWDEATDA